MKQHDYSDDDDFYSQDFSRTGFVSVWLALPDFDMTANVDALQDCCGVGYYNLDDGEANASDGEPLSIERLLDPISYSKSFSNEIVEAASGYGVFHSRWVLVQFDFEYDASRVIRPIDPTLLYVGAVPYQPD